MERLGHEKAFAGMADVVVVRESVDALTDAAWALGALELKVNKSAAMSRMLPRRKKRLERDILISFV